MDKRILNLRALRLRNYHGRKYKLIVFTQEGCEQCIEVLCIALTALDEFQKIIAVRKMDTGTKLRAVASNWTKRAA
jgi:hypothetical protein